tara:strand:+ start:231 stop:530 length:300 start_codon:yes stop_codon:yes gene_type:complete
MAYRRNNRRHRGNENRNYRDFDKTPPSKHPSNITVRPKPGEFPERAIKRFMKKVKKERVIENYREKTDYYKKPSVLRRRKAIRRKALLKKQRLLEQSDQ